jgi:DnaJ-like protein
VLTLDAIAERRIREAQERGEFDDLPGAGAPLEPEDNALVPEELRAAYRILRNSGFLPPELQVYSEIREVEQLLQRVTDDGERTRLMSRINYLLARSSAGKRRGDLRVEQAYIEKVAERLCAKGVIRES